MKRVEFGADGIRGVAGEWPFVLPALVRIGQAIGQFVSSRSDHPVVVMGRDTRSSGPEITSCLMAGLLGQGVNVINLEIITTPGVAYLTRRQGADLGLVVTASHSPHHMNGIKLIASSGLRLEREDELSIENLIEHALKTPIADVDAIGHKTEGDNLFRTYIWEHVTACRPNVLKGLRIVLDCAEGAAARVAPDVIRDLGAEVIPINNNLDGKHINLCSGSEYVRKHPDCLAGPVREYEAMYGFSFDGDGDRLVVVDPVGNVFDGYDLMYLLALHFKSRKKLRKNKVVTTHQANRGLIHALKNAGIDTLETNNGDHNLEKALYSYGLTLAGEPGGNIIINDGFHTAADGVYTAILLGELLNHDSPAPLIEQVAPLRRIMNEHPQTNRAVRIHGGLSEEQHRQLVEYTTRKETLIGDGFRARFWPSSTEPGLIRVMIEGCRQELKEDIDVIADEISDLIAGFSNNERGFNG